MIKPKIVLVLEGGVVTTVMSDVEAELLIIEYLDKNADDSDRDRAGMVIQDDGSEEPAIITPTQCDHEPAVVAKLYTQFQDYT